MNKSAMNSPDNVKKHIGLVVLFLATVVSAYGQKFELSPLFGGKFGGTVKVKPESATSTGEAKLEDSFTYGVAGGFRFDSFEGCEGCDIIEFRWMRQSTHLGLPNGVLVPMPVGINSRPSVTLDHFLGDFTHEFPIESAKSVRPYITGTLGMTRIGTPEGSGVRFAFGLGTGFKIFPSPHWGIRLGVEYLPTVMQAEVQKIICSGGCIVTVNGGLMNQFQFTAGPVFRF